MVRPDRLAGLQSSCNLGEAHASIDGTHFIVQQTSLQFGIRNNELDCTTQHGRLRSAAGRILLNDVDYGPIEQGDTLLWARDGQIYLNGTPCEPSGQRKE